MERNYKITIPEPCHEDWNKMTPNDNGRFCMNCSKTVTDFTSMRPEEIQHFFIQNQNKSVCGRFRKSQLDSITIQIPDHILYSQNHYHKMFLLALFVIMGTTLFSCADNEGNKVKIDKIEVVKDNLAKNPDNLNTKDSLSQKTPHSSPLHINVEPVNETSSGISYVSDYDHNIISGGLAFEYIEEPDYPGGIGKFSDYIKNEFQIPKKARKITGKIDVSFVVNKAGTLEQFKVFDNIGHDIGEEMIRVLQNSKAKWKPKIINGKAIPDTIKMNIVVQKDSLNIERKKRKLSSMERKHKITIPEPCHENWDKMTPKDNGRFCLSCSKTVVDFTSMLPEEIRYYFIQNQDSRICGRFKNEQLETITIQIPSRILYSQTQYHKMFLLALFIAMGTTLFSCSDKEGNKNKINNIEIVGNTEQNEDEAVSRCYGHQIESKKPNPKKANEQFMLGMVATPILDEKGDFKYHTVYNSADLDISPIPVMGMKKFYDFFNKNYTAPDQREKFKGKISILFVIEEDGSLSNFNIVKNTPKEIGEEAIRVLKTAPNWIPGKLNNKVVRSSYILPITIK
ncbi:energy transducer TonB [Flavobacterium foetidum]|uniref:energy transducer TonB n=1 Tax=Flavobacterium foetidum TaxID=2026681 RepID=UPI0010753455|nr:energy transducer TonB [Flavobacterium foetidum]KAF2512601.1 hypothetical protein E0W73_15805 [Flavobacterium foetidum]